MKIIWFEFNLFKLLLVIKYHCYEDLLFRSKVMISGFIQMFCAQLITYCTLLATSSPGV